MPSLYAPRASSHGMQTAPAPTSMGSTGTAAYGLPQAQGGDYKATGQSAAASTATPYPGTGTSMYGQVVTPTYGQSKSAAAAAGYSGYGTTPAAGNAYGTAAASAYPAATSAYAAGGSAYPAATSAHAAGASAYPATSAYGQPSLASAPSTSPAAAYAGGSGGGTSALGRTTAYGMPSLSNWQPALPVSPWSTYERGSAPIGGGVDTQTILTADLKALKRSRLKAWGYLMVSLSLLGLVGYYGYKNQVRLVQEGEQVKRALKAQKEKHQQSLMRLGMSESAALAVVDGELPTQTAQTPGHVPAPAAAGAAGAAGALAVNPASAKLSEDLKKQLTGIPGLTVEARGDRVVVSLDQSALFEGNEIEVGLAGYRVLYKFGKALKNVKDRKIVVTVPGDKRPKAWNIAAARSVSLGKFVIDDLNIEPHRVTAAAPGAPGRGVPHVEFSLESLPVASRS